jgi:hypothetical protein
VAEPAQSGCPINAAVEAELRTVHLGEPAPERDGPGVMALLAEAYAAAL